MLSNGIKEDQVSSTKEEPKKVERIVPIQMSGRERRSRSRDKAPNPFIDDDDSSKNKGEVTKLSSGKTAPLATAEVIIQKMSEYHRTLVSSVPCLITVYSGGQNRGGVLRL